MTWSLDKATSEDTDADVSGQLEDHQAGSNFQAVDIVRSSEEPMASCFGSAEIFFAACHQQDIVPEKLQNESQRFPFSRTARRSIG